MAPPIGIISEPEQDRTEAGKRSLRDVAGSMGAESSDYARGMVGQQGHPSTIAPLTKARAAAAR